MKPVCSVELIRWPSRAQGPHEVKVRVHCLFGGAETLTRKLSVLRRAQQVAQALATQLDCKVTLIDMRPPKRRGSYVRTREQERP